MSNYQKDWIISNYKTGNLLCITLESNNGTDWSLTEWVNHYELLAKQLQEVVDMGYMTMLDAAKKVDNYKYIIGIHQFSDKNFMGNEYLQELLPEKRKYKKQSFRKGQINIDKKEFEREINTLKFKETYRG